MIALAALFTFVAVWLWTGPDPATSRLARLTRQGDESRPRTMKALLARPSRSRRADAWRRASIELCHAMTAELSAGRTPGESLTRALTSVDFPDPDALRPVSAAARDGGDVSAALLRAAPEEGGEGLRRLAACWDVSITAGAGLSALVDRVAATMRSSQAHRQDVAAQLAGPRATAKMLAVLPALGLLMAAALGMRPLAFLLGSLPGLLCLTAGISLNACGLWWTHRMATRATNL